MKASNLATLPAMTILYVWMPIVAKSFFIYNLFFNLIRIISPCIDNNGRAFFNLTAVIRPITQQ